MTWLVIGISGATCSGKTTLAKKLLVKLREAVLIKQDDYFLPANDPRHVHVAELNHHNWDILESLDMTKIYKPIADLCHMKYFLDLTREECERRRTTRVYDPPDVPGYFETVVWPEYVKYKSEIQSDEKLFDEITFLDGTESNDETFQRVFREISAKL